MEDMRKRYGNVHRMTGALTDIDAMTCKAYVAFVGAPRSASMDLEMLRAAMNHAVAQQKLTRVMAVTLPEPALPRERWLSRAEVAKMVRAAWRHRRVQANGEDEWGSRKHIARFILASVYTGTRKTATLLGAFERIPGYGYIDLEAGLWYRQPSGKKRTKKRQPPVPVPAPLLGHMRRWRKNGQSFLVEYAGEPIGRPDKAYRQLVRELRLGEDVVIHTLRHTAITWGLQRGMNPWDASGYFGISLEVLMNTYGHHCPAHLRDAASKMARPAPSPAINRVADGVAEQKTGGLR
jgi:integrase